MKEYENDPAAEELALEADEGIKNYDEPTCYKLDDDAIFEKAEEDVQRDICLPSIKDSKLWRIKVTPGRERELVFKITNKLIEYLNSGDPLNVLEVFESELSQGIIYCEAYKS